MAKFGISDEDLPFLHLFVDPQHPETPTIELTPEEWADHGRVWKEFYAWQRRIAEAYERKR